MYKLIIGLTISCALTAAEDTFSYAVVRATLPRGEHGRLEVSKAGVSYQSDNGKTAIHEINVPRLNPSELMPALASNGLRALSLFSGCAVTTCQSG